MHIPRLLAAALLAFLLAAPAFATFPIPAFTPNVVDPGGFLPAAGREQVNLELQRIRDTSHVWGAVLIVDTLGGEPIENVANQAFEQWKLGQAGVDNGMLLVLAMSDRKSRFEVGYGLEGSIPDVAALHALDAYLAPGMRAGDTTGAIINAFGFLSRVVEQDPLAMQELAAAAEPDDAFAWRRGLIAWGVFLVPLWLFMPIRNAWVARRRRRLLEAHPLLGLHDEQVVKTTGDGRWQPNLWILGFLSLNPGVFVFILSSVEKMAYYPLMVAPALILGLVIYLSGFRYGSPARYRKHLENIARQRAALIKKGHLEESTPGVYRYTPAYRASRASSSSGRSFSSSSGGGRSGGGGASSGW